MLQTNLALAGQFILVLVLWFCLVFGVIGVAVGTGLVLNAPLMRRISLTMNRWVSLRQGTRWANVPRDMQPFVKRHRIPIGVIYAVTSFVSLYVLVRLVNATGLAAVLGQDMANQTIAWIANSVYVLLIAGTALAFMTGTLLLVSPGTLSKIEAHAHRWYSFRRVSVELDSMHSGFDAWVARFPRASGGAIIVLALTGIIVCGIELRSLG
jgi:hypothetical protein